ncbi:hypothetical protein CIHG_02112 [Coccidioides immitis H538.4]|uniref:Uncharacterized protein n=2 Tax=Coccidioides immitis TaxID=5501 RepID=A0A0J8RI67_COCIT|nr:hypothetical protein CIRG_00288 [Coccidioides immitis RMSCC 2394]KMU84326.1 hypothetical protein CIHG_02112 [Coccidioides immitis H538.4]
MLGGGVVMTCEGGGSLNFDLIIDVGDAQGPPARRGPGAILDPSRRISTGSKPHYYQAPRSLNKRLGLKPGRSRLRCKQKNDMLGKAKDAIDAQNFLQRGLNLLLGRSLAKKAAGVLDAMLSETLTNFKEPEMEHRRGFSAAKFVERNEEDRGTP